MISVDLQRVHRFEAFSFPLLKRPFMRDEYRRLHRYQWTSNIAAFSNEWLSARSPARRFNALSDTMAPFLTTFAHLGSKLILAASWDVLIFEILVTFNVSSLDWKKLLARKSYLMKHLAIYLIYQIFSLHFFILAHESCFNLVEWRRYVCTRTYWSYG